MPEEQPEWVQWYVYVALAVVSGFMTMVCCYYIFKTYWYGMPESFEVLECTVSYYWVYGLGGMGLGFSTYWYLETAKHMSASIVLFGKMKRELQGSRQEMPQVGANSMYQSLFARADFGGLSK
jgi:hypothetical protein